MGGFNGMNGIITWFGRNHVASNLLMWMMIAAGVFHAWKLIPVEFFPDNEPDEVRISMSYRGATPQDVEEGVVIKIENAIRDLPGIAEIDSTASEGRGSVEVEIQHGTDPRDMLDEIKNRVDAINTFSNETERPVIQLNTRVVSAITVIISGQLSPRDLKRLGEQVRDELATLPGITLTNLRGARNWEIVVDVPEEKLKAYGLTIADISAALRRNSIDLPAGSLRTASGDILLRTKGQAYTKEQFESILLKADETGRRILLKDVARVQDGFDEDPLYCLYNGVPSVFVRVERTGEQNLLTITDEVKKWLPEAQKTMPQGVTLALWKDNSRDVNKRLSYLLWNGLQGALLVFIVLSLFLRVSFAFWVVVGIPIAYGGGLVVMHALGYTINLYSVFGFIVVMGIITDDAIVTGESVFTWTKKLGSAQEGAIQGTLAVATPVTFGVLTVITAFVPLLFMTGRQGLFFAQLPVVIIPVLLASLVESKFILPAHLAKVNWDAKPGRFGALQEKLAGWLEHSIIRGLYVPLLERALRYRYAVLAMFIGILLLGWGVIQGGHYSWAAFPRTQVDSLSAQLEMPVGTPASETEQHLEMMRRTAEALQEKYRDPKTGRSEILAVMTVMGAQGAAFSRIDNNGSPERCEVVMELPQPDERRFKGEELKNEWRAAIGVIPGAKELRFFDSFGGRGQSALDLQIVGQDLGDMLHVSDLLQEKMKGFAGVNDVFDDFSDGKQEIQITRIRPPAESRGITREMVGRQLRQAFFGEEAQRIQRGRDDVRVMVRLPREEREKLNTLDKLLIRAPDGSEIPFLACCEYNFGRSATSIRRHNLARVIHVIGDVNKQVADIPAIRAAMDAYVEEIRREHHGLTFSWEGEAKDERETMNTMMWGTAGVLCALYVLMAIPFKSYLMPFIILLVIPFGWIGAGLGHMIKGEQLSSFSILGMLTLSGVVVNDSLVLVDYVNQLREEGWSYAKAVREAGAARFRAIFLTNLTTFAGLVPIIFQESTGEKSLTQMSISIAFGVIFSFTVTIFLVPINYLVLGDLKKLFGKGNPEEEEGLGD